MVLVDLGSPNAPSSLRWVRCRPARLWHDKVCTKALSEREKLVVLICWQLVQADIIDVRKSLRMLATSNCWQPVQAGKAACTRPRT